MISIETLDGELIKIIKDSGKAEFGFHKLFGFISTEKANKRIEVRKRQGFEFEQNEWQCNFKMNITDKGLSLVDMVACSAEKIGDNIWKLVTPSGEFKVSNNTTATISDVLNYSDDDAKLPHRIIETILLAIFIMIPILYFMQPSEVLEEDKKEKVIEAVTVKIVKSVNTVKISQRTASHKIKPLTETQKAKRAVKRNLGFLGLVGSKSLSKVVGGVPQKLKQATAGAGAGGDAGSGGEVLTGLGKGLKKTTVGNTGVAGLGGIGTKGAGGGAGGYGNTLVASGEGSGISAISVASNDMVLDGGLSRYAINATIAKYLSQVRRCYENQLNKQPGLEGLVTVGFQIGGSGMLNYSKVKKSSLGSPVVEKCITKKMMKWKFPKPKGGVNVNINYPFMLRPVGI
jgi:hypothetical protein